MTYKEIMKKIFDLEMKLASTTIDRQRKQIQNEISKLISLRDNILEESKPAQTFGRRLKKLPEPTEVAPPKFSNSFVPSLTKKEKTTFDKDKIFKNKGSSSRPDALDMKRTSDDNNLLGGSDPTDAEMNVIEQLVSKIVGRRVRFEDIPDDDPDFKQGEGSIEYPAGRPDLRMGGMTAKSAATTKFKKPLGMKGGGGISKSQRQRIARLMQEYKQKKARRSNGKRTNR